MSGYFGIDLHQISLWSIIQDVMKRLHLWQHSKEFFVFIKLQKLNRYPKKYTCCPVYNGVTLNLFAEYNHALELWSSAKIVVVQLLLNKIKWQLH